MKYEIIDKVSRFVERFGMVMDPETMNKARDEAEEYDFRLISGCGTAVHYAVIHGKKMYIIIERDGEIGCSCDDMTYNLMDGSVCKHIIEFSRLVSPVTKAIEEDDRGFLVNACGWTGAELHPEIELGGPGAVVQEDMKPAPKERISPDPDLDLGVDDPLPEKPANQADAAGEVTGNCQWCGKEFKRYSKANLKSMIEEHEAVCEKNPANMKAAPDEELKEPKEETKMRKLTWDEEAWSGATQGSFVTYGEDGIAKVLFTENDFEIGTKPDKWGRASYEFSVIQNNKAVVLSVGSIRLMNALKEILPLEGKMVKIARTGEGTGTKYEAQEVI